MRKLLILFSKIGPKAETLAENISEQIGKNNQIMVARFSDLIIKLETGKVEIFIEDINIKDFDLVYFRRIDHSILPLTYTLAVFLEKNKIKYFDTTFKEVGAGGDKVTSIVRLALAGVSVAKSIFMARDNILDRADEIISELGFPIIAKDTKSQAKKGIYVIRKKEDFKKLLETKVNRPSGFPYQFLFQKFLEIKEEYRLFVLKDHVVTANKRHKKNYDNLELGWAEPGNNAVEFVDISKLPPKLCTQAVEAAKALNLQVAGVDGCILTNGEFIIFEVNRGPGFEYGGKDFESFALGKFLKRELESK